jgi:hypothetical protein
MPGNGKTYLAETLLNLLTAEVYIPYAVESHGAITQIVDELYHRRSADDDFIESIISKERRYDGRWAKCQRPFLASGGELTMDGCGSFAIEAKAQSFKQIDGVLSLPAARIRGDIDTPAGYLLHPR